MKKKILIVLISCLLLLSGCRKNGKLDDKSVIRNMNDITTEQIHYFDNEAIALADSSGDKSSLRSEALRAYNLVNEQREKAGLELLTWDSGLESTSDVRAMECSHSFSHTRPDGQPWYTVNSQIMGGENLAYGYDNAIDVLDGWMNSSSHRENILYPAFTKIAISI